MADPIITVENLGKQYTLRHQQKGYTTLRETLAQKARALFSAREPVGPAEREAFWALKDVSFEIERGEVVGIIGRNGAGKSTLLKILSRITEPTTGRIRLRGRVASLLEVGTGFHPELTGRENVFLNGAILGMTKGEIRSKFDEIVAFAEVEKFLDTPVKHYSSGMYVRLAFAVAAHLEPEILIVDEVLAVGDTQFQTKCLGKMRDVASHDRTVLFVSHNLTAVESLCERAVYLQGGKLLDVGNAHSVLDRYQNDSLRIQQASRESASSILGAATISDLYYDKHHGGWMLTVDCDLSRATRPNDIGIDLVFRHRQSAFAFAGSAYFAPVDITDAANKVRCVLGPVNYATGTYTIDVRVSVPMKQWIEEHHALLTFEVDRQVAAHRHFHLDASRNLGFVVLPQKWSIVE